MANNDGLVSRMRLRCLLQRGQDSVSCLAPRFPETIPRRTPVADVGGYEQEIEIGEEALEAVGAPER